MYNIVILINHPGQVGHVTYIYSYFISRINSSVTLTQNVSTFSVTYLSTSDIQKFITIYQINPAMVYFDNIDTWKFSLLLTLVAW